MSTRRDFLKHSAAACGVLSAASSAAKQVETTQVGRDDRTGTRASVRKNLVRIKRVIRREETTLRLGGVGDNWHMSWAADDRQYVSLCDGFGWPGMPGYAQENQEFNSRMYAIEGNPPAVTFRHLPGYPEIVSRLDPKTWSSTDRHCYYYSFGTLAARGYLYQFLSTLNHPETHPDGTLWPGQRFVGAKLIYSPDQGRSWFNQDGAAPVSWETWEQRSRRNMMFFEEPQEAFSLISMLQMGKNYQANRDGYIYGYAPNGNVDGSMNELVMFRAPTSAILDRSLYEFFSGTSAGGKATWTRDIHSRAAIHKFPRGWVNSKPTAHPYAWQPSVVYNQPLDLFMMVNWGMGCATDGEWFGKPSYLGFWTAQNPWGPWTQIHEETAWTPANDLGSRAYQPQIAPKWISPDGKSFWLVWTDIQSSGARMEGAFTAASKSRLLPYYAFNIQRVDLVIK